MIVSELASGQKNCLPTTLRLSNSDEKFSKKKVQKENVGISLLKAE